MHSHTRLKPSLLTLAGRLSGLAYSLVSYVFFLLVFIYLMGFIATIGVPKGIDTGISALSWPWAIAMDVLLITLFAVQHSGMARNRFKTWWLRYVPAPIERATYVLFTSLVLALMYWLWQPISITVWDIQSPLATLLLTGAYWLGWIVVLVATFLISHFELFGIKQALDSVKQSPPSDVSFKTPLLYKLVRHPMYFGLLLAFWATPHMSVGRLVFAVTCTLYIVIGTRLEEKDLVALFGDHYRRYQQRIGMLIPFAGRKKSHDH